LLNIAKIALAGSMMALNPKIALGAE